jgi:hypothetical protein
MAYSSIAELLAVYQGAAKVREFSVNQDHAMCNI